MTAPQPATPGSDREVCGERSLNSEDGYCPCVSPAGHLDPHRCLHGSRWIRPAAPSEPPAETQQDDEAHAPEPECGRVHRSRPETGWACREEMVDGGSAVCGCGSVFFHHRGPREWSCVRCGQPAARPSADTETLRDVLLKHHPIAHTLTGPLKGCRCGQVRLGEDVIAHVANELLALLGGPQPDGEARQHRMDADCWCRPVQADNGAWDHQ